MDNSNTMEVEVSSPNVPTEVWGEIFKKLGKRDLLNLRQVCHSWNEECNKIFKKSNYIQHLRSSRLDEYLNFVNQQSALPLPRFALPFNLDIDVCILNPEIKIGLLIQKFGPSCVKQMNLTYVAGTDVQIRMINNILKKVSVSLSELRICRLISPNVPDHEKKLEFDSNEAKEILTSELLIFPNLKVLKLDSHATHAHLPFPFNFPKLEKLSIMCTDLEIIQTLPLLKLKTLKLHGFQNCQARTQNEILYRIETIKNEGIPWTPVLKELTVSSKSFPSLSGILREFSMSLKSLKITFDGEYHSSSVLRRHNPLPLLPKLKTLHLQYQGKIFWLLDHTSFNLNDQTLPGLETVRISIGCFIIGTHDVGRFHSDPTQVPNLTNVTHLILEVPTNFTPGFWEINFEMDHRFPNAPVPLPITTSLQQYLEHLDVVFPNVTRVTVIEGSEFQQGNQELIPYILLHFIQSGRAHFLLNH